jgi:PAS domain S-box-containing protein
MPWTEDEIRVLHIEDDPNFADLTQDFLERVAEDISVVSAHRGQDGFEALDDSVDCVVCDYDLPGLTGIEVLETIREARPDLPFILFTGKGSEEVASDAISSGVTDYLRKGGGSDQFEVLENRIRNAVEARRAEKELGHRKQALARERSFIDQALDTLEDVFYVVNEDGSLRRWNDRLLEVTGYTDEEIADMHVGDFFPDEHRRRAMAAVEEVFEEGEASLEAPLLTRDGELIPHEFSGALFVGPGEEARGLVGVGRDITERKRREEELASFQRAVERAADGIALLEDGEYIFVDKTHVEMYGFDEKEDLLGDTWRQLYDEEEIRRLEEEVFPVLAEEGRWRGEVEGSRPDGSTFPVELQLTIVDDGRLVCACRDMSERKEQERRLQRRTRRLETLISNLPGVVYRCRNEREWPMVHVGGECEELTGYEAEAFVDGGKPWSAIVHEEDRERVWEEIQASLEAGDPFEIEYRIVTASGEARWVWERGRGLEDEDGSVVALEGFVTEVTGRRRDKRRIQRQSRRFQATLEDPNILAGRLDERGHLREVNQKALEYIEADRHEVVGEPIWETPWWDDEETRREVEALIASAAEGNFEEYEASSTKPNGETYHVEGFVRPVENDDGEVVSIVISARDVTGRKQRAQALEETQRRLKQITAHIDAAVWLTETDTEASGRPEVLYLDGAEEVLGVPSEEVEDVSGFLGPVHPEDRERARRAMEDNFPADGEFSFEYRVLDDDGTVRHLRTKGARAAEGDGRVRTAGFTYDVTDMRETQAELEERQVQLTTLLETAPTILFSLDEDGRFTMSTGQALEALGLEPGDIEGAHIEDVYGDDPRIMANVEQAMAGERVEQRLESGGRWWEVRYRPTYDDGEVDGVVGVAVDVTQSHRQAEELAETNRRLEAVLNSVDAGIFIKDTEGRYRLMNESAREMFDVDESPVGRSDEELLSEELAEQCRASDERVMEGREQVQEEETFPAPDGQTRTLLTTKTPLIDEEGNLQGLCGISTEITDRRERQEELELKTRAMEEAPLGITLTDAGDEDNPILYTNEHFQQITGFTKQEVLGRDSRFLQGENTDPDKVERIREAIEAGEPITVELQNYRADGSKFWNRVSIAPVHSPDGEATSFIGFQQDVTDRREAEEQLRRSERSLRELYDITSDADRDFEEKLDALLTMGSRRLDLPFGYLAEIDVDGGLHRIRAAHGDHERLHEGATNPLTETYCRKTVERGELVALADASEEYRDDPAEERFELGAYAGAPVHVDGELWGTVCFAADEPRETSFSDAERVFMDLVAQWISHELERRQREVELREKNERLDQFASIVTHDLRNPLNVASGNLALAQDVDDVESPRLETVEEAHDRMATLIEEVLTLAREGEDAAELEETSLSGAAQTAWGNVETNGGQLAVQGDLTLDADESRLVQLLENLHRNAIDHAGPAPTVEVGPTEDGFYVEDDGPGIPEVERSNVMEAGYSTSDGGTGFGLGIVRQIAEAHGWSVDIVEGRDGGARFEFTVDEG